MDENCLPWNNQFLEWKAYIKFEVKAKLGLAHEIVSCGESFMKMKESIRAFRASCNSFQNLTLSSTQWTGRPPKIRTTDPVLPIKFRRHRTIEEENKFCDEDVNGN